MTVVSRTKPAGTSDDAVRRATHRGRDEWFALLDKWGAADREHRQIAAWLMDKHGVDNWWAQNLTVDYERARGLRVPGSSRDGTFSVSASKTVSVPLKRLFQAFMDTRLRNRWLPGADMRERTSQPQRSARFEWEGGPTRVNFGFTARGNATSQIALRHERLPTAKAAEKMEIYWHERLTALKALLEDVASENQ